MADAVTHVAVMGTGSAGMKHLGALALLKDVQPIAISQRKERAKELESAGYTTATDLDHAVQAGVTSCIVATDPCRHVQDCQEALGLGLNVLCEKPLARNAKEAHDLCAAANAAALNLSVGCVLRFSESLGVFREKVHQVGRVHSVRIECRSYLPDWRPGHPYRDSYSARKEEGGVLLDLIHEIDYAGWLFGWPDSVQARLRNLGRLGIDSTEVADLTWESPNGCLVSLSLDYLSRKPTRTMKAFGEFGAIEWDALAGTVELELADEAARQRRFSQSVEDMFLAQSRAFLDGNLGKRDPIMATGQDGAKALAICDAAALSSENKREELVAYP